MRRRRLEKPLSGLRSSHNISARQHAHGGYPFLRYAPGGYSLRSHHFLYLVRFDGDGLRPAAGVPAKRPQPFLFQSFVTVPLVSLRSKL
jgi:hypothetical protein